MQNKFRFIFKCQKILQLLFSICQHIPEFTDVLLWVPFAIKRPQGGNHVKFRTTRCSLQIVFQPATVSTLTSIAVIVGPLSPRTRIQFLAFLGHFLGSTPLVGVFDVLVEYVLRQFTVHNVELRVVVVSAQRGGTLGIELRVGNHQLLVCIVATIVPYQRPSVTIQPATGGIAPTSRTQEVHTRTAEIEIGMIVHPTFTRPQ